MKTNKKEKWKYIEGFRGIYQVSNLGNVRSIDRVIKCKNGAKKVVKGQILSSRDDNKGYNQVDLYKNGIRTTIKIHRLVAIAFLKNPNNLPVVNHINSLRNDNRVENLEWVTFSENNFHAYKYGRRRNKEKIYRIA